MVLSKAKLEMDEIDRKIVSILEKDPEISQNAIAQQVGISQPSVGVRIRKLKKMGIVSTSLGINFKKSGLYLAKVDCTATNTINILRQFEKCPYFLNGFVIAGKNNLCLFFVSEDIATLEAIVDGHFRCNPDIQTVDFGIVITSNKDQILPIKLEVEKADKAPCDANCGECSYYDLDRCLGCPVTGHYRGSFW